MTLREAILPAKVSEWRAKLSAKAKQEKRYRFYSLYGLISHAETLKAAWHVVSYRTSFNGLLESAAF